jgi:hypothetical protein
MNQTTHFSPRTAPHSSPTRPATAFSKRSTIRQVTPSPERERERERTGEMGMEAKAKKGGMRSEEKKPWMGWNRRAEANVEVLVEGPSAGGELGKYRRGRKPLDMSTMRGEGERDMY